MWHFIYTVSVSSDFCESKKITKTNWADCNWHSLLLELISSRWTDQSIAPLRVLNHEKAWREAIIAVLTGSSCLRFLPGWPTLRLLRGLAGVPSSRLSWSAPSSLWTIIETPHQKRWANQMTVWSYNWCQQWGRIKAAMIRGNVVKESLWDWKTG